MKVQIRRVLIEYCLGVSYQYCGLLSRSNGSHMECRGFRSCIVLMKVVSINEYSRRARVGLTES